MNLWLESIIESIPVTQSSGSKATSILQSPQWQVLEKSVASIPTMHPEATAVVEEVAVALRRMIEKIAAIKPDDEENENSKNKDRESFEKTWNEGEH